MPHWPQGPLTAGYLPIARRSRLTGLADLGESTIGDRCRLSGGKAPLAALLASTDRSTLGSRSSLGQADRCRLGRSGHSRSTEAVVTGRQLVGPSMGHPDRYLPPFRWAEGCVHHRIGNVPKP
jgi:hypothetical protein